MGMKNPFEGDPEFESLQGEAKEALSKMQPKERGEFMISMQEQMKEIMVMPAEERVEFIKKFPKSKKLQFVKFQILAMSVMQQQMQAQGGHEGGHCPNHGGYGGQSAPTGPVSSPAQQEMM